MIDREKVIKGLPCLTGVPIYCETCPYSDEFGFGYGNRRCAKECASDAIELLKEQDRLLRKKQKDIDKLCAEYSNLKHRFHEKTEIVRCKDCKDACIYSDDWVICTHIDSNGNDKHPVDWYCADGKRREADA